MLYELLYPLRDAFFGFNVLRYITFRAMAAAVTAFLICLILGPWMIARLKRQGLGQEVREKPEETRGLADWHQSKKGTPTMGGVLIVLAILTASLLWGHLRNPYLWLVMGVTVVLGALGFADDASKWRDKNARGISSRRKLIWQALLAFLVGSALYLDPSVGPRLDIPFLKSWNVNLGFLYVPFAFLVLGGTSNAVNLTDGLDGLAIGLCLLIALTYGALSYVTGHARFSDYLNILYVPGSGELAVFCASLFGAGLGFLWFNSYPATVFMGDTGALALGGAIGATSLVIKKELILILVGGIFVAEAVSVILQIASFRLYGKRLFAMAPLHHHFQLKGWSEPKVITRFWILGAILALLSMATLKLR